MEERVDVLMPYGYTQMWISTFHSFADRILRSEGLEIGLDPSYKIISTPDQWLLVRYEDLVGDPVEQAKRLCALVEEEFCPAMLEVRSNNSSFEPRGEGIFTKSVGRWRQGDGITPQEIYAAEKIAGREMHRYGYEPSGARPSWRKLVPFLCTTVPALVTAVAKNRKRVNLGGVKDVLPYLAMRLSPRFRKIR